MKIEEHVPLLPLNTLRVGGEARYLARVETESDLVEAIEFAREGEHPVFVIGGGSNLLVADAGFSGVIAQIAIDGPTAFEDSCASVTCQVPAAVDWDGFVFEVCSRGLTGVECLAGIPGTVGASPVQNIGAYGQEIAQTIVAVRALDQATMQFTSLSAAECGFGYRSSIFNSSDRGRYIVTQATFRFFQDRPVSLAYPDLKNHFGERTPSPMQVYEAVRDIRHQKGMLLVEGEADCRSAGSFFKNPIVSEAGFRKLSTRLEVDANSIPHWVAGEGKVKLAAAWLLEKAGFRKGQMRGRAGVSSRHTLALINLGGATAREIMDLRDEIIRRVEEQTGVHLEQEPVLLAG